MQNTHDLTMFLLPRVKAFMLDAEDDFKNSIKKWLSKKGWLSRFLGGSLIDPVWSLIIGPILPIIIKLVVELTIGSIAPTLVPLTLLIVRILDYIKDEVVDSNTKSQIIQFLNIVKDFKPDVKMKKALDISNGDVIGIRLTQEYFDSFGAF